MFQKIGLVDWLNELARDSQDPLTQHYAQTLVDVLANPAGGIQLMAAERVRQVEAKGFDAAHDDKHEAGEIAAAAAALALYHTNTDGVHGSFPGMNFQRGGPVKDSPVPFAETWMQDLVNTCRHKTDVRRLAIAGAMIAAEIDRLQRKAARRHHTLMERP